MKPSYASISLLAVLSAAASPLRAADASPPRETVEITPGFIDSLVAEAREHNPALQAAGARAEASSAAVAAVRTWDDPTASVGLSAPTARGFKSSEEGNLIYGVAQKLPLYGRPDLMRKVAAADASRDRLAAGYETEKLRRDVEVALNNVAIADREA